MNVKLISVTQPRVDGINNSTDLVGFCARVSNSSNQLNIDTMPKLLSFCIRNNHWSIFEMADMTVEIQTSRAISAQILRHRSFSFQEFSQRYAEVTNLEELNWRAQGKTNRQVGEGEFKLNKKLARRVASIQNRCLKTYKALVKAGVAKECARMVLPMNTQTTVYMKGSLRSWITYFMVRCDAHTQKEHRDVALLIQDTFNKEFPIIAEALESLKKNDVAAVTAAKEEFVKTVKPEDPNQLPLAFEDTLNPLNEVHQTAEALQTK